MPITIDEIETRLNTLENQMSQVISQGLVVRNKQNKVITALRNVFERLKRGADPSDELKNDLQAEMDNLDA